MHLIACMLVLSMAEDYAVFLLEVRDEEDAPGLTLVGLATACVTTVLAFGLLALSEHPALRALGMVTSLGVLLSMLMAPLALLAIRTPKP
jgi:predicted exporter